ncbi:MAG: Glutamyl-tRNA reductase [Chlamydiia bacterium]|nr:Glutamyl-tRNA reductase [Chlamydiia bacterium]
MDIAVVGVNHTCSSFTLREELTRAFEKAFSIAEQGSLGCSYVLLLTCNRAEIYFSAKETTKVHVKILNILRKHVNFAFEHALYSYFDTDTFLHLARVSSGLDSALVGESEIQSQVKLAYERARKTRELSSSIHYLFQKSLRLGKYTRSDFSFSKEGNHLSAVILKQLQCSFDSFEGLNALFLGNSEINRRVLSAFMYKPFQKIKLCTNHEVDCSFKKRYSGVEVSDYKELENLSSYDVVIIAGKYDKYLIEEISDKAPRKRIFFDLSVPRSVHPRLQHFPGLTLYDMEKLSVLFDKRQKFYKKELLECEEHLTKYVGRYFSLFHTKSEKKKFYQISSAFAEVC